MRTLLRKFKRARKWVRVASYSMLALVTAAATVVSIFQSQPASADQYDDKIAALQQDIAQYQSQANSLSQQAASLQNTLAQLDSQKQALQAQIDLNQAQYDQLSAQITADQQKIQTDEDALGQTIADLYVDGQTTPLEMLASSKNVSDYLNQQEYQSSTRDQLASMITDVKQTKQDLSDKQTQVAKVLSDEKTARDSLQARENQEQQLIDQTNNDEATYQNLIASSQQQINQARAIQAALAQRGASTGGFNLIDSGLNPSYITDAAYGPWTDSNCPIVYTYESSGGVDGNGNDGHGYGCRQCASYVAWKIDQTKGYYPQWGNAYDFQYHGTVDDGPHAGDVGVLTSAGEPGHVAWVETDPYVSTTGSLAGKEVIVVSQYNFNYGEGYGMYSEMELSVNFFNVYIKP